MGAMGRIMDTDAVYRIIGFERITGGHHISSVASYRHVPICYRRLSCRSVALVNHRSNRWINGDRRGALWAWSGGRVINQNHSAVLSNTRLGDIICLDLAV